MLSTILTAFGVLGGGVGGDFRGVLGPSTEVTMEDWGREGSRVKAETIVWSSAAAVDAVVAVVDAPSSDALFASPPFFSSDPLALSPSDSSFPSSSSFSSTYSGSHQPFSNHLAPPPALYICLRLPHSNRSMKRESLPCLQHP